MDYFLRHFLNIKNRKKTALKYKKIWVIFTYPANTYCMKYLLNLQFLSPTYMESQCYLLRKHHIPSLLSPLRAASWKRVVWKHSPAQLTLLFHMCFLGHSRNFSLFYSFITSFSKVVRSQQQQNPFFTWNSVVPIFIARKACYFASGNVLTWNFTL